MKLPPRFLLFTYPLQGHINPSLQFSKRLSSAAGDAHVTFVTTVCAHRLMSATTTAHPNISFTTFSDGNDDGAEMDSNVYFSEFRRRGSQAISELISSAAAEGRPYTCLVYTILLAWAGITAEDLGVPSFLLWIQPATVFDIYYYFFHGYEDILKHCTATMQLTLPGLPFQLTSQDIPSFMDAADDKYSSVLQLFREQFELLDMKTNAKVLVNTFDELESQALRAVHDRVSLIGIGPLIPSAFLDEKDPTDTSFGGDLFKGSKGEYKVVEWLNSKPKSSVIYVSFGSLVLLSKPQKEEIAEGLLECGRPFLWVIRENTKKGNENDEEKLSCEEELKKLGLIVPWCGQVEVLSNDALACFVTHCGWNSTLESLACGVPVVAFPQWSDQGTNAKLIEEVWRTGVRVKVDGKDGIVSGKEIKRCLEVVLEGDEFRNNANNFKCLAREAATKGGSSYTNLKAFVADVVRHDSFNAKHL